MTISALTGKALRFIPILTVGTSFAVAQPEQARGQDSPNYDRKVVEEALAAGVIHNIQSAQSLLRPLFEGVERSAELELKFTANPEDPTGPLAIIWTCPHEFGSACDLLVNMILTIGGSCEDTIHGVSCSS
jgi:hypothetical protein